MTVINGPWGTREVRQEIGEGTDRWWVRDDDGALVVWCHFPDGREGPAAAPVPLWPEDPRTRVIGRGRHAEVVPPFTDPGRPPEPSRISMVLDVLGYDGPEVDEALGVATPTDHVVDDWEAGRLVPSYDDVRRLSTLTGYGPRWFYGPPIDEPEQVFICGDAEIMPEPAGCGCELVSPSGRRFHKGSCPVTDDA